MQTYTNKRNAVRAARKQLGRDANPGRDFTLHTGASGRLYWEPVKPVTNGIALKGQKESLLLDLLFKGVTHEEACKALGWQECHATLRRVAEKAGHRLSSTPVQGSRTKRYFVEAAA